MLALGAAWFLDNGEGSERYAGTFRGQGISSAPLHLVRVDLATAAVTLTEICGLPNGLVANPPIVDAARRIVVGYDSGNGVLAAFDIGADGSTTPRWRREQNHACHPLLFPDTGELVTNDHDATRMADSIVVLDIEIGRGAGAGRRPKCCAVGAFSCSRLRSRLLLLLICRRDPGCSRTLRVSSRAGSQVTTW